MATIEIKGRTWTSLNGPNFTDEQIAEMLAWQQEGECATPAPAPTDALRAALDGTAQEPFELTEDELLTIAGNLFTDRMTSRGVDGPCNSAQNILADIQFIVAELQLLRVLRRREDTAPPVALTEAEKEELARTAYDRVTEKWGKTARRWDGDEMEDQSRIHTSRDDFRNAITAVLAKLEERGYAIVRRTA